MKRLTLRQRSLFTAFAVLLGFIPAALFMMDGAYTSSMLDAKLSQMRLLNLTLISEFEVESNRAVMPEYLFDDDLNMPTSGFYGFIQKDGEIFWQSVSTLQLEYEPTLFPPPVGQEYFLTEFGDNGEYFLYAFSAEFETENGYRPVSFFIMNQRKGFDDQRIEFIRAWWRWLALLSALLLGLMVFSLHTVLAPVQRLISQIQRLENGEIDKITQQYPPELEGLKHGINHLVETEQQQRARYKNSLSDLAHSLKTPVAVIQGLPELPDEAKEPLAQVNNIIQRQLVRAAAGSSGWHEATEISPICTKLVAAMDKVYRSKQLQISADIDPACRFGGDPTDLMELLGNVLDNACKAAKQQVALTISQTRQWLDIVVEDDGPGIAAGDRVKLLQRGSRLDTYQDGQGIGMAVVSDLVAIYQGRMQINNSALGGAQFVISFPRG